MTCAAAAAFTVAFIATAAAADDTAGAGAADPALPAAARRPATAAAGPASTAPVAPDGDAGTASAAGDPATAALSRWVLQQVRVPDEARAAGIALALSAELGSLSPSLPPCERAEPFVVPGTALWGRGHIGIRCIAGARWTSYLPVRVRATGPAWVARERLPMGAPVEAGAFERRDVDWAAEPNLPVARLAATAGDELARPLQPGATLTAGHLRRTPTVRPGDTVPFQLDGDGFSLATEGVALNAAAPGQTVRLRAASGRMLTGVLDGRVVHGRR